MLGKNWVDNDDPGDERRVYGLGHEWCQGEARRIVEERRLAAQVKDIEQSRPPDGETQLEAYLRDSESEAAFRAAYPSLKLPRASASLRRRRRRPRRLFARRADTALHGSAGGEARA
jgi:hypothetical protein